MATVRIALCTDLHAYVGDVETIGPSYLNVRVSEGDLSRHPMSALLDQVARGDGFEADILLCAGDIGDKANPEALQYAWTRLHDLRDALGADWLVGTAGNHDMDSRQLHNHHDARGALQGLRPLFPINEEMLWDKYWSRNFAILDLEELDTRIVTLNSAAYHGYEDEWEHGRISQSTISLLRTELENAQSRGVNLLLCHHHPREISNVDADDYSRMKNADALLDLLGSGTFGRWTIIHGHKHHPNISAGDHASAPMVFAAGSFSAVLHPGLSQRAANQFYVLEFESDAPGHGLGVAATFRSWDWIPLNGWQPAGERSGMPAHGGFGYRADPEEIARIIIGMEPVPPSGDLSVDDLLRRLPKLRFMQPRDIQAVYRILEDRGVKIGDRLFLGGRDD